MRRILQGHYVTAKRSRVAPTRRLPAIPCKTLRTRCRLRWPQGQGYQVQIAETYSAAENEPALSLITHVAVESAAQYDSGALLPAIEGAQKLGLPPKKALADTAYGSAENHQQAAKLGVELIAPVPGKKPQTELSLADFSFSDDEKVSACPQGQVPFRQSLNKKTRTAFFTHSTCDSCSKRSQSPVLDGKKGGASATTANNPAFARSHSPIALSLRKRGALSYCGTITPVVYLFHASFKEAR